MSIGLCPHNGEVVLVSEPAPQPEVGDDGPMCTLCEYTIGDLDKYISDKKNEEEIKQALDKVCYHLR